MFIAKHKIILYILSMFSFSEGAQHMNASAHAPKWMFGAFIMIAGILVAAAVSPLVHAAAGIVA